MRHGWRSVTKGNNGETVKAGDPGRGARYNSAVKYLYSHRNEKHLVVVISEDGDCDFVNYNIMDS